MAAVKQLQGFVSLPTYTNFSYSFLAPGKSGAGRLAMLPEAMVLAASICYLPESGELGRMYSKSSWSISFNKLVSTYHQGLNS